MVYETDFYTTRRPYRATPSLSTYTITTPRYYTVRESPERSRRAAEEQYSYSYTTESSSSNNPYSRPTSRTYTSTDRVSRSSDYGPGSYSNSTERTSRSSGDGPGGYHSSYSSSTSGRLPGGTSYRHYSYRSEPSRQVRILPGLGKVHVVHTYDRIVPYVGHKRLNVVTSSPIVVRVRPSTLYREYDRIENKYRPFSYHSYTNDYLNSESHVRIVYLRNPISSSYPVYKSSTLYTNRYYPTYGSYIYYPTYLNSYYYPYYPLTRRYLSYNFYPSLRWYDLALFPSWRYNHYARMFDDETRNIRAQTASILQRIHDPVPRKIRSFPLPYVSRYDNFDDSYYGAVCKYQDLPARLSNDHYINRLLISSPSSKSQYTVYSTEPVRKFFGQGHLACVTMVGDKSHLRRRNVYTYQDPVRNDIQLLSYYINKFRDEKSLARPIKADANVEEQPQKPQAAIIILSASRPSRIFSVPRPLEGVDGPEVSDELQKLKQDRNSRLAKIMVIDEEVVKAEASVKVAEERAKAAQKKEEETKKQAERASKKEESRNKKSILATIQSELSGADPKVEASAAADAAKKAAAEAAAKKAAEEEATKKAAEEEAAKKKAETEAKAKRVAEEAAAKKKAEEEEAAAAKKKAEEEAAKKEKEAKEAAEKAAELERLAEQARQEELAKQAEIEKAKKEEEEKARLEEEKRLAEAAKAEEEKQQLLRLEEIARQAEEEKEAELARQAEELAELARQEAELAEQTKHEEEVAEEQRKEADHAEIEKKEKELAELEQKEKELTEVAEQARIEADQAQVEAEQANIEAEQAKIEAVNIEVEEETAPIVEEPETPEETTPEVLQEPAEEVQE